MSVAPARRGRLHRHPPRVRAGRVRRSGAARRGVETGHARPRAGDDARVRHRAAQAHARPPAVGVRLAPARAAGAGGAGGSATRAVPDPLSRRRHRLRRRQRERRAGQALKPRRRPAGQRGAAARRPRGPGAAGQARRQTPQRAAILHSVPDWLAEMWWRELGPERARALLQSVNTPAETAFRVNTLRATPEAVMAALATRPAAQRVRRLNGRRSRALPELPEVLVLDGAFDAFGSELFKRGELMPQSRASAAVARVLAPRAGRTGARPLCGAGRQDHAPGGADGAARARSSPSRFIPGGRGRCGRPASRWGRDSVRVEQADAREFGATRRRSTGCWSIRRAAGSGRCRHGRTCAGSRGAAEIGELAAKQAELLRAGAARLRPGGIAWCTPSARSAGARVRMLSTRSSGARSDFSCEQRWQLLPSTDGTDGFFIARLRRAGMTGVTFGTVDEVQRDPRAGVPELPRAVAASGRVSRPLPLPVLHEPLRAPVGLPQLRRALDDRAHVDDRDRGVQSLPGQHAEGSMTGTRL